MDLKYTTVCVPMITLLTSTGCASSGATYQRARTLVSERTQVQLPATAEQMSEAEPDGSLQGILTEPLDVAGALRIAALHSPLIKRALAEVDVHRSEALGQLHLEDPSIDASWLISDGEGDSLSIHTMMPLTDLMFFLTRQDEIDRSMTAGELTVAHDVARLLFEIKLRYYEATGAAQRQAIAAANLEAAEAAFALAERIDTAGNAIPSELTRQALAAEDARALYAEQAARAAETRRHLGSAIGLRLEQAFELRNRFAPIPTVETNTARLSELAVARSLALQAAKIRSEVADDRAARETWQALIPRIGAGVEYESEQGSAHFGPSVSVSIPLFSLRRVEAQRAAAAHGVWQTEALVIEEETRTRAADAAERLSRARERALRLRDHVLPLRRRMVEELLAQNNAMTASVFELIAAKQAELTSQLELAQSFVEYWTARTIVDGLLAGVILNGEQSPTTEPSTGPATQPRSGGH